MAGASGLLVDTTQDYVTSVQMTLAKRHFIEQYQNMLVALSKGTAYTATNVGMTSSSDNGIFVESVVELYVRSVEV